MYKTVLLIVQDSIWAGKYRNFELGRVIFKSSIYTLYYSWSVGQLEEESISCSTGQPEFRVKGRRLKSPLRFYPVAAVLLNARV
jgi:hypothetical protein